MSRTMGMVMLLISALLTTTTALMDDVTDSVAAFLAPPECPSGCMNWTAALNASEQAASFADPSVLPSLGARCAIPGRALHTLTQPVAPSMTAMEAAAFYGPICPCRTSSTSAVEFHTCTAPFFVPEQINLQLANSTTVVVSFVTHEHSPPIAPPMTRLGLASAGPPSTVIGGVSHWYETANANGSKACAEVTGSTRKCNVRNLTMHFIRFPSLEPRQSYSYQVRSGGSDNAWSQVFTFRAPYGHGTAAKNGGSNATRVAIYGDMGNDASNNMGNLRADCASGIIDTVVHMGDHAYNMANGNDYHGDAYMQAFQHVLARCPWLPMIGNHESTMGNGGDKVGLSAEQRYLNQTWGVIFGQDGAEIETSTARTTATTSLGHLITRSSFYGAASHSAAPSRTSQWYSIDLGLIHFVILDLDPGPPAVFSGDQLAWAIADLTAADANRANVPWIVVTSHFPLYTAAFDEEDALTASAAWYNSDVGESERNGDGTPWSATPSFEGCAKANRSGSGSDNATCATVKDVVEESITTLGPLLDQYHVDIYAAGHIHGYSATWPILNGAVVKESFVNPNGTVHITEGNGGVPGTHQHSKITKCKKTAALYRICGMGMNYGRLVTTNATVLTYEHVETGGGHTTDTFSIVKTHH
eukprot:m.186930 g.186930  ORF g.186930 m.186930 type:complete len:644 (-) comp32287_c0_seq1:453-2384(-)